MVLQRYSGLLDDLQERRQKPTQIPLLQPWKVIGQFRSYLRSSRNGQAAQLTPTPL